MITGSPIDCFPECYVIAFISASFRFGQPDRFLHVFFLTLPIPLSPNCHKIIESTFGKVLGFKKVIFDPKQS